MNSISNIHDVYNFITIDLRIINRLDRKTTLSFSLTNMTGNIGQANAIFKPE